MTQTNGQRPHLSMDMVRTAVANYPARALIYGPPKTGKSTFALEQFPNPIFLQAEDGTPTAGQISTFGLLNTADLVDEAISALAREEHQFQTLVLDSVEAHDLHIAQRLCMQNGWKDLVDAGFGKGFGMLADEWARLMSKLDWLRKVKNMNVVLIGHSEVTKVEPPSMPAYSKYDLRLHKRSAAIIKDEVDLIAFINFKVDMQSSDEGFGKTRHFATGGGTRWIYTEARPAFEAGSRWPLPAAMPIQRPMNGQGGTLRAWCDVGMTVAGINC